MKNNHIAIVGVGPRGLSALENLCVESSKSTLTKVHIFLFETAEDLGAGCVWSLSQPETNWSNISERALKDLSGRKEIDWNGIVIPSFKGYEDWNNDKNIRKQNKIDSFPPRSKMGRYLKERFDSISNVLVDKNLVTIIKRRIQKVEYKGNSFVLTDNKLKEYIFSEVVLTIGHQDTCDSDQIKKWEFHAKDKNKIILFKDPYPVYQFMDKISAQKECVIALRGFGLAMIDVCRALTIGNGGNFEIVDSESRKLKYIPGTHSPKMILPFSLDGLPPVPKPLHAQIDNWFLPSKDVMNNFCLEIRKVASGEVKVKDDSFLISSIAKIASKVYFDLGSKSYVHTLNIEEISKIVTNWLKDPRYTHPLLVSHEMDTKKSIETYVNMATGAGLISLDYCIGQVWRHCQPNLYKELSHSSLSDEIMSSIIKLDEESKRYSYGPPVESMQQLLALISEGIINLDYVKDPDITMTNEGWKFISNTKKTEANVMINTVLDPPKILDVTSSLIKELLKNSVIRPIHSQLGVETSIDGRVKLKTSNTIISLAMLGRLCKGSVIGVDAILECFGPRIKDWAKGVVERCIIKENF